MASFDRVVFTDGGARPNPGPGGWAAIVIDPASNETVELSGGEAQTTNNRMELEAAIRALASLSDGRRVELFTDSTYVRQGITSWISGWRRKGWRTAAGTPVKNADLWRALDSQNHRHDVTWRWVKGHAGHEHNERADALCTREIDRLTESVAAQAAKPSAREELATPEPDVTVALGVTASRGRGAWVATLSGDGKERELEQVAKGTSANRLELEAALAACRLISDGRRVLVLTASDYLRNGASQWLDGWIRNGWRTSSGPVKNEPLWRRIARERKRLQIEWRRDDDAERAKELKARCRELLKAARTPGR